MSLAIDVDTVVAVLLADGWHKVTDGSFELNSYEFVHAGPTVHSVGKVQSVPTIGTTWVEADGTIVSCPLTSVLAVRQGKATVKAKPQ
jgi:hypothetical protein